MIPETRTRVLLFSPPLRERTYPGRPPIYYLSAVLRRAGHDVKVIDVDIAGVRAFVRLVKAFQPQVIGGSSLSIQINDALKLFKIAKFYQPEAITVLGGNHATAASQYLYPLHDDIIDVVIAGEGLTAITAIADLVGRARWDSNREEVPGALFCDGGKVIAGRPSAAELPDSYDPDLPYDPSYDFEIFKAPNGRRLRTFQLMTAFGCHNACFFCFSGTNKRGEDRRGERRRSIASVDATLRRAASFGYEAIYFDDDTFTRVPEHAIALARLCKKYGLVFGCHTRPDCEDERIITELVANGCVYMFSGLESAVPEILLGANKTDDPVAYRDTYRRSYAIKNRLGIQVCAFLIHGMARRDETQLPDIPDHERKFDWRPDTLEDSIASIEFAVRELDPTYVSMNILRFIPGVPFAEAPRFAFLRPVRGPLHGGYFDAAWVRAFADRDPRCFHPILRAFEGAGSPTPQHMTPRHCYNILRSAVAIVNAKNAEPARNQTRIVVDPWFKARYLPERWSGNVLQYELASFEAIDVEAAPSVDGLRRTLRGVKPHVSHAASSHVT